MKRKRINTIRIPNDKAEFYMFYMRNFADYNNIKYTYSSPIDEEFTYIQFNSKKERDEYLKWSKVEFKQNKEMYKLINKYN